MAKQKNKIPLTPEEKANKQIAKLFGKNESKAASAVAGKFFGEGSLGRVTSGFDENGNRIAENQDVLDRLKGQADSYYVPGANRSADTQQGIDLSRSYLQGYSAPEFTAMREAASRGINSQYETGMYNLAKTQARSGVRGAASSAQNLNLDRARMGEQTDLETNLFVKGADAKRDALTSYNNLISGVEGTEYNRSRDAQSAYADQLAKTRTDELGRQEFNLGQVGAEKAGNYGAYFGSLGFGESKQAQDFAQKYGNKYLDILKAQIAKAGAGPNYAGFAAAAGAPPTTPPK